MHLFYCIYLTPLASCTEDRAGSNRVQKMSLVWEIGRKTNRFYYCCKREVYGREQNEVIISLRRVKNLCCYFSWRCFCLHWPLPGNVTQSTEASGATLRAGPWAAAGWVEMQTGIHAAPYAHTYRDTREHADSDFVGLCDVTCKMKASCSAPAALAVKRLCRLQRRSSKKPVFIFRRESVFCFVCLFFSFLQINQYCFRKK